MAWPMKRPCTQQSVSAQKEILRRRLKRYAVKKARNDAAVDGKAAVHDAVGRRPTLYRAVRVPPNKVGGKEKTQ